MDLYEISDQVVELLRKRGRLSYQSLKYQFRLDDEGLAALKEELLYSYPEIVDDAGRGLVWTGGEGTGESESRRIGELKELQEPGIGRIGESATVPRPPVTYTPVHLADRIRAVAVTDGERKTITAMFADLKGSTALIEGLDPEEARTVIDPALHLMMDAVHQYDGFVAQALGDGIFALFGAPLAHEDHPQRALYAALRMQDTMRRYGDTLRTKGYPPLLMRVGLNTGEVVLRSIRKDDLHADYVPVGHSTNLAARMEQLATPGSIVVSAYTHRLTDGYFAFKDLGPTQIKGVEEPLNLYEVLGVGQLRTRLQVSASRYGLTRFVGRQRELEQLNHALTQAKAGHGQIVGTMGEPGLGKSRLFHEFKLLSLSGCLVLEAYSVSHGKATAYLPVIELLKSYFRIESQDDERTRREKVNGKVLTLDRNLEATLPYLFTLLGIEEQPSPLAQMDPQIRRQRTFEALKKLFLRESLNQPLVLIFEDLHWIDGETQGFLNVLSESVASAKLLLLTNYRPEYRHEWGQKTYYTQLRLAPLGRAEAEEFLDALLRESPRPVGERDRERGMEKNLHAFKQLILDKTQGTPFFMEEIVQELREQGVLPVGTTGRSPLPQDLQIPTTVQAVLAARIDRLAADEKALLQQLAVIGRQFPLSLVRQVVTQPEADFYKLLASLQHKEFLYEQPTFPESEYIFKHALTQEVAYGTVLQERRKALHERTGQAIETLYGEDLDDHYSELAHHYSQSANIEKAVAYLRLAGQQAVRRSANDDAVRCFIQALELLHILPATSRRDEHELTLQLALGPLLMATKGWGSEEASRVFARAEELSQQTGNTPQLFATIWGRWMGHLAAVECERADELGQELVTLAARLPDPLFGVEAYYARGLTWFERGEFKRAGASLEQAIALYDSQQHSTLVSLFTENPGVVSHSVMAEVVWVLGYPDQSLQHLQAAQRLARDLAHPFTLNTVLVCSTLVHEFRREAEIVGALAEAGVELAREHGFAYREVLGTMWQRWLRMEQGCTEAVVEQFRQGLNLYQAAGVDVFWSYFLVLLAGGYRKCGKVEEGLPTLHQAEVFIEKTEEHFYKAELYRLKGALTLQSKVESEKSKVEEAEACFLKAIEIAQKQHAKSLELRAATSLARLWQSQGKQTEARGLLAPVYNWFTEGFDTKDLQEAKALIEELRQ